MDYPISNFSKGLVDEHTEADLDREYRQKCRELTNFYITESKRLQPRPPLKQVEDETGLQSVTFRDGTVSIEQFSLDDFQDFLDDDPDLKAEMQPFLNTEELTFTSTKEWEEILGTSPGTTAVNLTTRLHHFLLKIRFDARTRSKSRQIVLFLAYDIGNHITDADITHTKAPLTSPVQRGIFDDVIVPLVDGIYKETNAVESYDFTLQNFKINFEDSEAILRRGSGGDRVVPNNKLTLGESNVYPSTRSASVLAGIFLKDQDGNIEFDTTRQRSIDYQQNPSVNIATRWRGLSRDLFIKEMPIRDSAGFSDRLISVPSDQSVEFSFLGMRYVIDDNGVRNFHSESSLIPEPEDIYKIDSFKESNRKLHGALDYKLGVFEIDLRQNRATHITNSSNLATNVDEAELSPNDIPGPEIHRDLSSRVIIYQQERGVTLWDSYNRYINDNPSMRRLTSHLRPCITNYVPYNYETGAPDQTSGAEQRGDIYYMLPDITVGRNFSDSPSRGQVEFNHDEVDALIASNGIQRPPYNVKNLIEKSYKDDGTGIFSTDSQIDNYLFSYREEDEDFHVFWSQLGSPAMDRDSWGDTENQASGGQPGIVLHVQTGNIKNNSGRPIYNNFGTLMQGLSDKENTVVQDYLKTEGQTVKVIYLTYDYQSTEILTYFNSINILSSIENKGQRATPVQFHRVGVAKHPSDGVSYFDKVKGCFLTTVLNPVADNSVFTREDTIQQGEDGVASIIVNVSDNDIIRNTSSTYRTTVGFTLLPLAITPSVINATVAFRKASLNNIDTNFYPTEEDEYNRSKVLDDGEVVKYLGQYERIVAFKNGWVRETDDVGSDSTVNDTKSARVLRTWWRNLNEKESIGAYMHIKNLVLGATDEANRAFASQLTPYVFREKQRGVTLNPSFTQVTFLEGHFTPPLDAVNRRLGYFLDSLNVSGSSAFRRELKDRFSNTISNYTSESAGLQSAPVDVLGPEYELDKTPTPNSPTVYTLTNKDGTREHVIDVDATDPASIIIGAENSVRILSGNDIATLTTAGCEVDVLLESRFVLHGDGNNIHQTAFQESAGGWVSNPTNPDLRSLPNRLNIVNLYSRHRLFLFYQNGDSSVYCLTIGENRDILGFSKFDLRIPVKRIHKVNNDVVRVVSNDATYEMDFSSGIDTDYTDDTEFGEYECVLSPLPVSILKERSYAGFDNLSIKQIALSFSGYADIDIELEGDGVERVSRSWSIKDTADVSQPAITNGVKIIRSLPSSSAVAPIIRIIKRNNKFLSLSSMVLRLAGVHERR